MDTKYATAAQKYSTAAQQFSVMERREKARIADVYRSSVIHELGFWLFFSVLVACITALNRDIIAVFQMTSIPRIYFVVSQVGNAVSFMVVSEIGAMRSIVAQKREVSHELQSVLSRALRTLIKQKQSPEFATLVEKVLFLPDIVLQDDRPLADEFFRFGEVIVSGVDVSVVDVLQRLSSRLRLLNTRAKSGTTTRRLMDFGILVYLSCAIAFELSANGWNAMWLAPVFVVCLLSVLIAYRCEAQLPSTVELYQSKLLITSIIHKLLSGLQ